MADVLDVPDDPDLWTWEAFEPAALLDVMRGYAAPWAVAGGWAIELALGTPPRAHHDVDIAVLRRDQELLQRAFAEWELFYDPLAEEVWWCTSSLRRNRLTMDRAAVVLHHAAGRDRSLRRGVAD